MRESNPPPRERGKDGEFQYAETERERERGKRHFVMRLSASATIIDPECRSRCRNRQGKPEPGRLFSYFHDKRHKRSRIRDIICIHDHNSSVFFFLSPPKPKSSTNLEPFFPSCYRSERRRRRVTADLRWPRHEISNWSAFNIHLGRPLPGYRWETVVNGINQSSSQAGVGIGFRVGIDIPGGWRGQRRTRRALVLLRW